jgi:hypothetical protein
MISNRRQFDPLSFIPSPAAVRQRLDETRALARKLEILLDVSTRISNLDALPLQESLPDAVSAPLAREVSRVE